MANLGTCIVCSRSIEQVSKFCSSCGALQPVEQVKTVDTPGMPSREPTPGIVVAAVIVSFFVPILGLILGYSARKEVRNPKNPREGDFLATLAIIFGWIWIAGILLITAVSVYAATTMMSEVGGNSEPVQEDIASARFCDLRDVYIEPNIDKLIYSELETPMLSMTITNSAEVACNIEVGTDKQQYLIMDGVDVVWDSTVCQAAFEPFVMTFQPGESISTTPFEWNRTNSVDCLGGTPVTGNGSTYDFLVNLGELNSSESRQFTLK